MDVLFHISSKELIETFNDVKRVLRNNQLLIFDTLATITAGNSWHFVPPSNPSEFAQKYLEIEKRLNFPDMLSGRDLMMRFIEEIWSQVLKSNGLPGLSNDEILDVLAFQMPSTDVTILLTYDSHWAVGWTISPRALHYSDFKQKILLEIYDKTWGEIVPAHILQFVHMSINSYKQGMIAPALVLLSICVEATLRDALMAKGYSFNPRALSVDEYPYTEAEIGVDGSSYTVTFSTNMPKPPGAFMSSTGGKLTVPVQIRRVIVERRKNKKRIDLNILAPMELIDHLSSDAPLRRGEKRVNGLGEAFDIARNKDCSLTPEMLPLDFDDVIEVIRNNLIHATKESLSTPLKAYDPSGHFTLGDFLNDPKKVYDLMVNIPRFINDQYITLRKMGHLAP